MKQQRLRFKLLALFLFALFGLLAAYGGYSVVTKGSRWFSSRWNSRVVAQKENVTAGDILDRNGVLLAHTENGERQYQENVDDRKAVVHLLGDTQGQVSNGVESFQAAYLYGFNTPVWELAGTLLSGRERRGDTLRLTVDSRLCAAIVQAYAARENTAGKNGAAVVMNYRTGEVLALVSLPVFDPLAVTEETRRDPGKPFWNRATQSVYPPGSTFKIVTTAASLTYLPDQIGDILMNCQGGLDVDGQAIRDWGGSQHGKVTLPKAFRVSCNNAFALLALNLGDEKLRTAAERFGFNDNFLFRDLVVENSSYPAGSSRSRFELACTGFGQSVLTATPVHLCMIAGGIANGGVMMEPRLLKEVSGPEGAGRLKFSAAEYRRALSADDAAYIGGLMKDAVQHGTGTGARVPGLSVCGKTGSAESSLNGEAVTHGWFIGYCEEETCPFAVAVLVENVDAGEGGGSTAAPLAAEIFTYLKEHPELVLD